jgi:dienelactone hydrolase
MAFARPRLAVARREVLRMTTMEAMAAREVLYRIPGMDSVVVEHGRVDAEQAGEPLTFDLYRPPGDAAVRSLPLVVVVAGFPDAGMRRILGRSFKETGAVTSWCRLLAASGVGAVAYANREPREDLRALLAFLRREGRRVGLFATSGNAPLALGAAIDTPVDALALAYPYTLDLDGATTVAEAARAWGFANGGEARSAEDLPAEMPLLLMRAGRDQFTGLNEALDRVVQAGLRRNLRLECVNLPDAPHGFDLEQDGEPARRAIRRVLAFFRETLSGLPAE